MYIFAYAFLLVGSATIGQHFSNTTIATITLALIIGIIYYILYVRMQPEPWGEGSEFAGIAPLTILFHAVVAFLLSTTTMWVSYYYAAT